MKSAVEIDANSIDHQLTAWWTSTSFKSAVVDVNQVEKHRMVDVNQFKIPSMSTKKNAAVNVDRLPGVQYITPNPEDGINPSEPQLFFFLICFRASEQSFRA